MKITCTWRFDVVAEDPTTIPPEVDRIMAQLLAREDAALHDSAVGLDLGGMTVDISVAVNTDSLEHGLVLAMAMIRSAIDAAGGSVADSSDARHLAPSGVELRHGQLTAA